MKNLENRLDKGNDALVGFDDKSENQSHIFDHIDISPKVKEIGEELREPIWEDVSLRINRNIRIHLYRRISIAAACILLLLGLTNYFSYQQGSKYKSSQLVEVVNPLGTRSSFVLSDGTRVTLNAGSKLIYPSAFVSKTRDVEIRGEAYFDVTSDPQHPFIVKSGDVYVKVLGTHFNVKSYEDDNTIEVTLVEGKVGITVSGQPDLIYIHPQEQILFNKENKTYFTRMVDSKPYVAWKEGKYYFNNQTFEEIVKQLERSFNVKIHIASGKLKDTLFSGEFVRGENLEQILRVITADQRIQYKRENNQIYLEEKKR